MAVDINEVRAELFRSLKSLAPRRSDFQMTDRLDSILNPRNDDGAAMAFDLERRFNIRIPPSEWGTPVTVQDVVNLVVRHLSLSKDKQA